MIIREANDYFNQIRQRLKGPDVRVFALETWYKYMFPYIPYRTGVLASTNHLEYQTGQMIGPTTNGEPPSVSVLADGIHFSVPYAKRLYFGDGFNFSKEMHPLAQAHWGQVALDIHGRAITSEIATYIINKR